MIIQSLLNWLYFILFTQEQTHDIDDDKQVDTTFTTKNEKETTEENVEKGDEETK